MLEFVERRVRKAGSSRAIGPIVLACDESYAMPLATTLRSIVEANVRSWPLEFYVLSSGITDRTREKVFSSLPTGSASITWLPVALDRFRKFRTISHISQVTYARLLIPLVLPTWVSRVLFLDADLLVLGALTPLWETDLDGSVLGAVADHGVNLLIDEGRASGLGVPQVRDYFNAGVLLIDLDRWRQKQISEIALGYLERHPDSPYSDQDALNVACDGQWKRLDQRWNFQDHIDKPVLDIVRERRPEIVHFATARKPWNRGINTKFYDTVRRRTLFARTLWDDLLDVLRSGWGPVKYILPMYKAVRHQWRRSPAGHL